MYCTSAYACAVRLRATNVTSTSFRGACVEGQRRPPHHCCCRRFPSAQWCSARRQRHPPRCCCCERPSITMPRLAHKPSTNCHAAAAAGALVHHSSSWRDAAMQCHPRPARIARLTRPASLHRRMRVDHDHDGKGRRWWRAMPRLTRALSSVPRLAHTLTCVPICPITQARRGGKALSLAWRA